MAEFRTNPGDRGVSELERDVDSERERVSATIDELRTRASTQGIVDQVVRAVAENGGDVSRNLGRSLRDNPLAALLTGVGLAWLMAGSGRPAAGGRWEGEPDDVSAMYDRGRFGVGRAEVGVSERDFETRWPADGRVGGEPDGGETDGAGLGERVSDAAARVGDGVSGAVGAMRDGAAEATQSASDAMHRAGDAARRRAKAARRGAARRGADLQDGLDSLIQEQPLVLGAIAMALGAAVGGALPRSRLEDRVMGARSDQAIGAARAAAEEQGAKLQAAAGAVAEEALDIADETAADMGSRLPSGEEMVDAADEKLRDTGSRLRQAAERETDVDRS